MQITRTQLRKIIKESIDTQEEILEEGFFSGLTVGYLLYKLFTNDKVTRALEETDPELFKKAKAAFESGPGKKVIDTIEATEDAVVGGVGGAIKGAGSALKKYFQ